MLTGPIDDAVRRRIVAETHGNPLALLELPRGRTSEELAGGFGLPDAAGLSGQITHSFAPIGAAAIADPIAAAGGGSRTWGRPDPGLAGRREAGRPPDRGRAGDGGGPDRLRRRGQVPPSAGAVHGLPGGVGRRPATGRAPSPRRPTPTWTRTGGPGTWRTPPSLRTSPLPPSSNAPPHVPRPGGLGAAAAFLARAAQLTPDTHLRAERTLAAALAKLLAGAPHAALQLVGVIETGTLTQLQRARVDLLRAQVAFTLDHGSDVHHCSCVPPPASPHLTYPVPVRRSDPLSAAMLSVGSPRVQGSPRLRARRERRRWCSRHAPSTSCSTGWLSRSPMATRPGHRL